MTKKPNAHIPPDLKKIMQTDPVLDEVAKPEETVKPEAPEVPAVTEETVKTEPLSNPHKARVVTDLGNGTVSHDF